MTDKNQDYDNESYWEKVRDFNLSRTPFWISILFECIATIGPWLAIWLLIGPDFIHKSFNFFAKSPINTWSSNGVGFVALISCMYLLWAWGLQTASYFLKWQKADSFTYTLALSLIFFMIIMNGCWMYKWSNTNTGVKVITEIVICIFVALLGVVVGVIISTFVRNYTYKIEEEDEVMLIAFKNGEEVPTKQQIRIQRAEEARKQREIQLKELDEFRASIDNKIEQNFIEEQKKREKMASMSKEELKQYKKEQKAEARKQKIFNKQNKHADSKEIHGLD